MVDCLPLMKIIQASGVCQVIHDAGLKKTSTPSLQFQAGGVVRRSPKVFRRHWAGWGGMDCKQNATIRQAMARGRKL